MLRLFRSLLEAGETGQVPVVRLRTPQSLEEHAHVAAELAGLVEGCEAQVTARGERAVAMFTVGGRRRAVVHPPGTFDVERTLRALDSLLPDAAARRLYQIERASMTADSAITFATERELLHLVSRGWVVVDGAPGAPNEVCLVAGLRVRGPVLRWDDGTLKRVELAEDAHVYGLRCAAGTPVRFVESRVCDVTLGEPAALPDCTLPPGTRVFFHYRSRVIGLARLGARVEIAGLVLPAGSELELDANARLVRAVLGADTTPPSGYRERGMLPAETSLTFADGKWRLEDPDRAGPSQRPRARRGVASDRSPALRAWSWLAVVLAAPVGIIAALAWARSKDVGERCRAHVECHHLLGDRCNAGVCAPACATDDDCSGAWTCAYDGVCAPPR